MLICAGSAVWPALPRCEGRERGGPYGYASCALPEVVCRMNLALIASALDAAGARTASAHLDPAEGRCCVTVRLALGEPGPPA